MGIVLLIGGLYNWLGALALFRSGSMPSLALDGARADAAYGEYVQSRLFIAGTALTFGAMYFYLYFHQQYAVPFLVFGAFLKYWAFLASLVAWRRAGLERAVFLQFGVANLAIAVGFTLYLVLA